MTTLHPLLGIALVLLALGGLAGLLALWKAKRNPHPELLRKTLHMGMGLITLSFPWLFAESWPVWTLAVLAMGLMTLLKRPGKLKDQLGGVVHGVQRRSLGDLYFPFAVALVFQLAAGSTILYLVPVLLLTLADAFAALAGIFYGQVRYEGTGGRKSAEGSFAFFSTAFLCVHVPLLLLTGTGRAESLLLGVAIALLVMLIEAASWDGLDNLLIPLAGFLLLQSYGSMTAPQLLWVVMGTIGWVLGIVLLRGIATLNDSALLAGGLVCYFAHTLGGWLWVLPPLLMYAGYAFLWPRPDLKASGERTHDVHAVVALCGPAFLWLGLARAWELPGLFYPYTVFYAAQLAFIGVFHYWEVRKERSLAVILRQTALLSWIILFLPYLFLLGASMAQVRLTLAAIFPILAAAWMFHRTIPNPAVFESEPFPWHRQALIGTAAAVVSLLPLVQSGVMA